MMRSVSLFAVAVLAIVLAVSSLAYAQPAPGPAIDIAKVTSNGDATTQFTFDVSGPNSFSSVVMLTGGALSQFVSPDEGSWTIAEVTPLGWVLTSISCSVTVVTTDVVGSFGVLSYAPQTDGSSFVVDLAGRSVTIRYALPDIVECTFTNSPITPAVGGVVMLPNTFVLLSPWLAVVGLVSCVGTVAVMAKKRRE